LVFAILKQKEPIMNEEILKELKTLNRQDGSPHIGHSIFTESLKSAIALAEEISKLGMDD